MPQYKEGATLDIFDKKTGKKINSIVVKQDCCGKILSRQIFFTLGLSKDSYTTRIRAGDE